MTRTMTWTRVCRRCENVETWTTELEYRDRRYAGAHQHEQSWCRPCHEEVQTVWEVERFLHNLLATDADGRYLCPLDPYSVLPGRATA